MGRSILKRLTLVLSAIAFVLATALPSLGHALAMPMPPMTCSDCPDKAPASNDFGKMACGALACAGIAIGLPVRQASYLPAFEKLVYPAQAVVESAGASPAPDPFPPRPAVLA